MLSEATVEIKENVFWVLLCSNKLSCEKKQQLCSGIWISWSYWSTFRLPFADFDSRHIKSMSPTKWHKYFWQSLLTTWVNLMGFSIRNHRRSSVNQHLSVAKGLKIKGLSQTKGSTGPLATPVITKLKTVGGLFIRDDVVLNPNNTISFPHFISR